MKTFLWGFFFSFPSSSPLLLLLLLPGGWCPSPKNQRTVRGEPSTGARGEDGDASAWCPCLVPCSTCTDTVGWWQLQHPAPCKALQGLRRVHGDQHRRVLAGPTQKQGFKPFGCFAKKSAKPSDSHGREFAGKRPRATELKSASCQGHRLGNELWTRLEPLGAQPALPHPTWGHHKGWGAQPHQAAWGLQGHFIIYCRSSELVPAPHECTEGFRAAPHQRRTQPCAGLAPCPSKSPTPAASRCTCPRIPRGGFCAGSRCAKVSNIAHGGNPKLLGFLGPVAGGKSRGRSAGPWPKPQRGHGG